jgi:signal peptidase I
MHDDPRSADDGPPPDRPEPLFDAHPRPPGAPPTTGAWTARGPAEPGGAGGSVGGSARVEHDATTGRRETARRSRTAGRGSFLRELPVLLLIAFVLAFLLRTFVLQVFYIPSSSMEPTLQIDDRMVVEKVSYRLRGPERGEIVVFEGDTFDVGGEQRTIATRVVRGFGQFLGVVPASARDFVKRVIGLPGDEILIEGGQVYVNGEALDEPYVVYDDGSDFGPVTVPDGHLFFLGDNRPNSSDSRRSLGFVPLDHVVGRSTVIIWPFDHAGSLMGVRHEVDGVVGAEPER